VVPGCDLEAIESFDDTQVMQLLGHVAPDDFVHFVAFVDGSAVDGKVIHLSEDKDKPAVRCLLLACFPDFIAGHFLIVSLETQAWLVGATFKPFVVGENVMDMLVPQAW
jgi:hypothetical protein